MPTSLLAGGPLGFCLEKPLEESPDLALNPDDGRLARLLAAMLTGGSREANVCARALNSLRRLFAMAATPGQTMATKTLAFSWPMQVPVCFLELVGRKRPEALVVLAHYCILLKTVDSFWFMEGCAEDILSQCEQGLDKRWHYLVEWPKSRVREGRNV